ncbi:MAG: thymidylate kinase [Symbiobacteriaceae bacterium]|jgi:dTMP kinase|nr:thymidylate kinase [Symbiobacteriaceae bacterium]
MNRAWSFYGQGFPYLEAGSWPGRLIALEGADGAGRSTQIAMLTDWLERHRHPVLVTGLRRSALVGKLIARAKLGNRLGRRTRSLLYATDLADQLENQVIPALRAGFVVLADRYIFSAMARDLARGAEPAWLEQLYGFALKPDLIIYLQTTPRERLARALAKSSTLDYWESGLDLGLADDRVASHLAYQSLLQEHLDRMADLCGFVTVDASAPKKEIHEQVRSAVEPVLEGGGALAGS